MNKIHICWRHRCRPVAATTYLDSWAVVTACAVAHPVCHYFWFYPLFV